MTALHSQAMPSVGDGSSDGHSAIWFGFVAEQIIDLAHFDPGALYNECLARLLIADSVLLQGIDFIGDLESRCDIGSFDRAMVELVLDVLHEERNAVLGCNVSPATLADRNILRSLVDLIAKQPWLAGRLTLEVTESHSLHDIPDVGSRLAEVQQLGCRLALDDFGAGHTIRGQPYGLDVGARFGQGCIFQGPVQQHWARPDAETRGILERAMTRGWSPPHPVFAFKCGSHNN